MVKYSDDTEYEMIELASLFDLDNARIVQAQIDSIDGSNNCAAITFSSECAELSGLSVDAVKFFYHCENSTGTEEDLADGHKAFKANEYVYCLWCPASPTIDERFFIIGHVDIRGTVKCFNPEILYLRLKGSAESGSVYCLFDTSTGTLLDVENFVNIDESSPEKPSSAIGLYTSSFYAWLTYNFSTSISFIEPSHTVTLRFPNNTYSWTATGSTTTAYTGTQGWITGSNPIDCEEWFDPGNGHFSTTSTRSFQNSTPELHDIEGTQTCTISLTDPYGSHSGLGDDYCDTCWGSTQYNNVRIMNSGSVPHNGIRIWDGVDSVEYIVELRFENIFTDTNITTLADGVFHAIATKSVESTFSANFNSIVTSSPSFSVSSHVESEYQLDSWPAYGAEALPIPLVSETGDIVYNEISTSSLFMRPDICDIWASNPKPLTMGTNGAYIIICGAVFYKKVVASGELFKGFCGSYSTGPDKYVTVSVPTDGRGTGFGTVWDETWIETVNGEVVVGETIPTGHFKVFPCAVVSMYNTTFTGAAGTSFTDILQNNNSSLSHGLSNCVSSMYDFMSERLNALGYTATAIKSFYEAYILGRVSVMPMLKKAV